MRGLLIVFALGIVAGFLFFSPAHVGHATAPIIECEYQNEPCTCTDICVCGQHTIPREECYSKSNL